MSEHRHPRCVTPAAGTASQHLVDQQAARILELDGMVARGRASDHDLRGRITRAEGTLAMIAYHLDLDDDVTPAQLVEAIRSRL